MVGRLMRAILFVLGIAVAPAWAQSERVVDIPTRPGVTQRILTSSVAGLDNYKEMMRLLVEDKEALKVFVNVGT